MAFKRAILWVFACVAVFNTPGFAAITSKDYVDTHVKNQVSTLATKAELTAGLAGKQAAGDYALKADVPTKTSNLTNDSGFITSAALNDYAKLIDIPSVPTNVSELTNDSGFVTADKLPTKTSSLTNDSGYITSAALNGYAKTADLPTKTSQLTNDSGYITDAALSGYATTNAMNTALAGKVDSGALTAYALKTDLPTKTSQLTNDSGFITSSALSGYAKTTDIPTVPTKVSELTNDSGYITNSALSGYATTSAMNSALSGKQDALTAAQQNAVNSGITAAKVSTYDGYAAQIAGKQAAGNYALKSEIPTVPTAVSAFTNDAGYVKSSELPTVPTKTSQLTNDSGFITASEVTLPDMSNYATKADLNTKVDTGAVTQTLQGTYTVSGKFYVPTPALPTE